MSQWLGDHTAEKSHEGGDIRLHSELSHLADITQKRGLGRMNLI